MAKEIKEKMETQVEVIQTQVYKTSDGTIYEKEIDANMAQFKMDFKSTYSREFEVKYGYELKEVTYISMFDFLVNNKDKIIDFYKELKAINDNEKNRQKKLKGTSGGLSVSKESEGQLSHPDSDEARGFFWRKGKTR